MSIKAETRQQNNLEEVDSGELNAWRRGFTPQAEIWNGRLAMLGLSIALGTLFVIRASTTGMPAA
ncbi:high light inducible protein [Synechococcus sp. GEYO]|uniref:high light inducible protein n=1 Tax=Synechococcus sp. GEYO TaxID=2575511 RepID=UPI000E0E401F|nr:high light inducible protein [Synechococcus sp. GEYO]